MTIKPLMRRHLMRMMKNRIMKSSIFKALIQNISKTLLQNQVNRMYYHHHLHGHGATCQDLSNKKVKIRQLIKLFRIKMCKMILWLMKKVAANKIKVVPIMLIWKSKIKK